MILQGVGMTLGYFAVCLLAFTNSNGNGFGTLSFTLLIAYQLFWGLITMLLPKPAALLIKQAECTIHHP